MQSVHKPELVACGAETTIMSKPAHLTAQSKTTRRSAFLRTDTLWLSLDSSLCVWRAESFSATLFASAKTLAGRSANRANSIPETMSEHDHLTFQHQRQKLTVMIYLFRRPIQEPIRQNRLRVKTKKNGILASLVLEGHAKILTSGTWALSVQLNGGNWRYEASYWYLYGKV